MHFNFITYRTHHAPALARTLSSPQPHDSHRQHLLRRQRHHLVRRCSTHRVTTAITAHAMRNSTHSRPLLPPPPGSPYPAAAACESRSARAHKRPKMYGRRGEQGVRRRENLAARLNTLKVGDRSDSEIKQLQSRCLQRVNVYINTSRRDDIRNSQ
jgi:hypothetical protein